MPNIEGSIGGIFSLLEKSNSGAFTYLNSGNNNAGIASGSITNYSTINYNASLSNPIYGSSETVTPESLSTKFFIKF